MKYSLSANSPIEEIPPTAQFVKGLFIFSHPRTNKLTIVLPAGQQTPIPLTYTLNSTTLTRGSPSTWSQTTIGQASNKEQAILLVTNDIINNVPQDFQPGCKSCGH